jgi:hypothetical protein
MKNILKEYGVIVLLIVVAISGYFLFSQNKQDILAYTMDTLGARLAALATNDESRERIVEAFDLFSDRVARQELSPEQIELVAANVLNLSAKGEAITPEEAEFMLYMDAPNSLPSPLFAEADEGILYGQPAPVTPIIPIAPTVITADFEALGSRLEAMVKFAETVEIAPAEASRHYQFVSDSDGIHVVIDQQLGDFMSSPTFRPMARDLEERRMVRFNNKLAEEMDRDARGFNRRRARLTKAQESMVRDAAQTQRLNSLVRIQRLGGLGVRVSMDSTAMNKEVELMIMEAMSGVESLLEGMRTEIMIGTDSVSVSVSNQ